MAILQVVAYFAILPTPTLTLMDTDCYMRLVRVEHWAATNEWFANTIPQSNAPFGESQHWSRPLDILLLLGAKFFQPLLGFEHALLIWGILLSPLLQGLAAVILAWGMIPCMARHDRFRLLLLFTTQIAVLLPFLGGRPDHHSLLSLLFVLDIALLVRLARQKTSHLWYARVLGLSLALAMWVSIESLTVMAMTLLVLGVWWAYEKNSRVGEVAFTTFIWALTGCLLSLALDRPAQVFFIFQPDRLSFQHVELVALLTAGTFVMRAISFFHLPKGLFRLAAGGGIALLITAAIYLCVPMLLHSPYSLVKVEVVKNWLNNVAEVQPIAQPTRHGAFLFLLCLNPLLLVLPWMVIRLSHPKNRGRFLMMLTAVGLVVFLPLSFFQVRWIAYAGLLLIFPLNLILSEAMSWVTVKFQGFTRSLVRAFLVTSFLFVFLAIAIGSNVLLSNQETPSPLPPIPNTTQKEKPVPPARLTELCDWLLAHHSELPERPRFLNFIDDGPELLYRTKWEVIATPYHRNSQGIYDTYKIFSSEKGSPEAEGLLRTRSANLILLKKSGGEAQLYSSSAKSLYRSLADESPPLWAKEIRLPDDLQKNYRLYRIVWP